MCSLQDSVELKMARSFLNKLCALTVGVNYSAIGVGSCSCRTYNLSYNQPTFQFGNCCYLNYTSLYNQPTVRNLIWLSELSTTVIWATLHSITTQLLKFTTIVVWTIFACLTIAALKFSSCGPTTLWDEVLSI